MPYSDGRFVNMISIQHSYVFPPANRWWNEEADPVSEIASDGSQMLYE